MIWIDPPVIAAGVVVDAGRDDRLDRAISVGLKIVIPAAIIGLAWRPYSAVCENLRELSDERRGLVENVRVHHGSIRPEALPVFDISVVHACARIPRMRLRANEIYSIQPIVAIFEIATYVTDVDVRERGNELACERPRITVIFRDQNVRAAVIVCSNEIIRALLAAEITRI